MVINKKYKPELIVSEDSTLPNIGHPHLDRNKQKVIATNGHMMIILPVQCADADTSGAVPKDALKVARKEARKSSNVLLELNGAAKATNGQTFPRPDLSFPPYEQLIPNFGNAKTHTFAFNATYLKALSDALGIEKYTGVQITINLDDVEAPILVRSTAEKTPEDAIGILMPTRF